MSKYEAMKNDYASVIENNSKVCFCVGHQNGQPLCPCRMERIDIKDGRCIETIDHGPVK
jgi:hypothetical protein